MISTRLGHSARPAIAVALLCIAALKAGAQTGGGPLELDGTRLNQGRLTYTASLETGGLQKPLGDRVVDLLGTSYAGRAAWLILDRYDSPVGPVGDSLVVDQSTLAPLHWGAYHGATRLAAEFRGDTIYGGITAPSGRRTLVGTVPNGALVNAAMAEVALRVLPLGLGWIDSTTLLQTGVGSTSSVPAEIAVIGEEQVSTFAGGFECWVVTVTTEKGQATYWVAKRERIVVRMTQLLPGDGGLLTYTLSRLGS